VTDVTHPTLDTDARVWFNGGMSTTHTTHPGDAATRVAAAHAADAAVAAAWSALVAAAADEADAADWSERDGDLWATRGARVTRVLGDPQDPRTQAAARRHTLALRVARRAHAAVSW